MRTWERSEDQTLFEIDEFIDEVFPTTSGKKEHYETYAVALRLVGAKHSKSAMAALVNWLLVEREELLNVLMKEIIRRKETAADVLSEKIEDQKDLSRRTKNWLIEKAQIETIGELVQKSPFNLMSVSGCGRKTLNDIKTMLKNKGLSLRG
jgi:DNA-directed RNA polymerase subunit alpha